MAGNLVIDSINGVNIAVSPPATQAYANSLLAEYTVTGSAVTSIDFSGLDIKTHKSYKINVELVNATASQALVYMFINGDTLLTNYYTQITQGDASTTTSARYNTPAICTMDISSRCTAGGEIGILFSGHSEASLISSRLIGSATPTFSTVMYVKNTTVTNITQLTFTSSVASAIGVGSKIRIYRGDV